MQIRPRKALQGESWPRVAVPVVDVMLALLLLLVYLA